MDICYKTDDLWELRFTKMWEIRVSKRIELGKNINIDQQKMNHSSYVLSPINCISLIERCVDERMK